MKDLIVKKIFIFLSLLVASSGSLFAQCTLSATTTGQTPSNTHIYVLVSGGIIIDQNTSGTFSSVSEGTYQIHALNYDPLDPPSPLPSDLVGQNVNLVGSVTAGCYNADFLTDVAERVCSSCTLSATSSGSTPGNTQVYVLTDESGVIIAQNSSGSFASTGEGVYHIYALNYDPSDPPSPLPSSIIGQNVSLVGTTTAGCYNADFLTDYVEKICSSCNMTATSSGSTPGNVQVYVLVDANGNIVAQNTTGSFSGLSSGTYEVHALNYDPSDPPSPLPSALVGQPLTLVGSTTAGCSNSDFVSDFVVRACSACFAERTLCETDPFVVSSSSSTPGNTQLYVLTTTSGNILSVNSTGIFTGLVPAGMACQVYALNYDPLDPPSPLPVAGDDIRNVGSTTAGCYNPDFLTDYLCYVVTPCILPLQLTQFEAKCEGVTTRLRWASTQEKNHSHFEVEGSEDGATWRTLDIVDKGISYTNGTMRYEYSSASTNLSYYRLKIVSTEGSYKYSKVLEINCETPNEIVLFPNPNGGIFHIQGLEIGDEISCFTSLGTYLMTKKADDSHIQMDFSRLPKGMYTLKIFSERRSVVLRVVIE